MTKNAKALMPLVNQVLAVAAHEAQNPARLMRIRAALDAADKEAIATELRDLRDTIASLGPEIERHLG